MNHHKHHTHPAHADHKHHAHHHVHQSADMLLDGVPVAIVTVSDRASTGEYKDEAGPVLAAAVREVGGSVQSLVIVPDEHDRIVEALRCAEAEGVQLILTSGGTGCSPRDVTPEATQAFCKRMVPGIAELMRMRSLEITPRAVLSRAVAGLSDTCLVINLPGSPRAALENFGFVVEVLDHALKTLSGVKQSCARKL